MGKDEDFKRGRASITNIRDQVHQVIDLKLGILVVGSW